MARAAAKTAGTSAEPDKVKVPPLHERDDVLEDIAAQYNGGNNLQTVQDEFRGALKMLIGTAIPKGHDTLTASIQTNAKLIKLDEDQVVTEASGWIASEHERHPAKPAAA